MALTKPAGCAVQMKRVLLIALAVGGGLACASSSGLSPEESTRTYDADLMVVKASALAVLEADEQFTITRVTETTIEAFDKYGFQRYELTLSFAEVPDGKCKVYAFVKLKGGGGSLNDWGGSEKRVVRILDSIDEGIENETGS